MQSLSLVTDEWVFPKWAWSGHVSNFYIVDLENFADKIGLELTHRAKPIYEQVFLTSSVASTVSGFWADTTELAEKLHGV